MIKMLWFTLSDDMEGLYCIQVQHLFEHYTVFKYRAFYSSKRIDEVNTPK